MQASHVAKPVPGAAAQVATAAAPSDAPVYDVDLFSDAVILDPLPHYRAMRALGPLVWMPAQGVHAVTRYAECREALTRTDIFRSGRGVSLNEAANRVLVGSTLNSDSPAHEAQRAVSSRPLLPGALERVRERIERAAESLVEDLCARGEFDAVSDFARYLPLTIVRELVGLPIDKQDRMLAWAAATFDLMGPDNARAASAWQAMRELRAFVEDPGTRERLVPGGWAAELFRAAEEGHIPLKLASELMRDYINPSLDTTIAATAYAIHLFIEHPDQWDRLRAEPALIPGAVEEIVRLASPIRGFSRYVGQDTTLGGIALKEGERVFVLFASANRDERKFADPDRFDVGRGARDHLGFGGGIHACMGMHLARLEIVSLLAALARRVLRFERTGAARLALNNTIHAFATLPVRIEARAAANGRPVERSGADVNASAAAGPEVQPASPSTTNASHPADWLEVEVASREPVAEDVVALELVAPDGSALPVFEAGAHVDVQVQPGLVRQYSLCNAPGESGRYRLGILRDATSRGGSAALHARALAGTRLAIGAPRNHFPLDESAAHTVLVAGGIGVTPLMAMAARLDALGRSFELHLCARSATRAPFAQELRERFGARVHLHRDDGEAQQRLDLAQTLRDAGTGWHLYVCGPRGFMDWVTGAAANAGLQPAQIHLEHFGAEIDTDGEPFRVLAARSGIEIEVAPGATVLDALAAAGIAVPNSCRSGVCGTCLTRVLEGTPEHRDLVLTDAEKAAGDRMAICCSRARTARLSLDL